MGGGEAREGCKISGQVAPELAASWLSAPTKCHVLHLGLAPDLLGKELQERLLWVNFRVVTLAVAPCAGVMRRPQVPARLSVCVCVSRDAEEGRCFLSFSLCPKGLPRTHNPLTVPGGVEFI